MHQASWCNDASLLCNNNTDTQSQASVPQVANEKGNVPQPNGVFGASRLDLERLRASRPRSFLVEACQHFGMHDGRMARISATLGNEGAQTDPSLFAGLEWLRPSWCHLPLLYMLRISIWSRCASFSPISQLSGGIGRQGRSGLSLLTVSG